MKKFKGITIGGLKQKIFNLMVFFILALIAVYGMVSLYQQQSLTEVVDRVNKEQQDSITEVSGDTMTAVLSASMAGNTELQASIADNLFSDVRTDVLILKAYAEDLSRNRENLESHEFHSSDAAMDGVATVQLLHEEGVDPEKSKNLGLIANMSDIMLDMFENSEKLNSCFVATTDGCLLFVNDRSGAYVSNDGEGVTLQIRERPWYLQAVDAGKLIFTGVELDAFTNIPGLVCAVPVFHEGELVAVVGADIFLTNISELVNSYKSDGSFVCVVNERGQVIFSPHKSGVFRPEISSNAKDLRKDDNEELADFVSLAMKGSTGLKEVPIDDKEYYMSGSPMKTVGWSIISVVDKETTNKPAETMLASLDEISKTARDDFAENARNSLRTTLVMTVLILILAILAAMVLANRIVKPVEHMTKKIDGLGGNDDVFEMEDIYRTGDEIEVLAESFETMTRRTKNYIGQITEITAEKERIGAELALATRIQADMLPNIYPAFPERSEFDIYAAMDPAKEVGGDFYDFFLIDDNHLGIVMADVSGKGVPAALFMMISKILVQNIAMTGIGPAEVLAQVNEQICANNKDEMFVTVWLGILDIKTGKITAANAGHEYPTIMLAGGDYELLKDKHGFVIGGMDGMKYKDYEIQLTPGSRLFLYTDGVPEATDANSELFGTDRMLEALNKDKQAGPVEVLKNVREAVDGFVKDAEQFDDLTMLCLQYIG